MDDFTVKDSGTREEYASGMKRDTQEGKPRYDLIDRAFLKRWATHMALGAAKYGDNNWRLADSEEEYERFQASGLRHYMQWMEGDRTEDHAAAIAFNVAAAEYVRAKLDGDADLVESMQLSIPFPMYRKYKVGDPDPTGPHENADDGCAAFGREGYVCTWESAHMHPQHVASDGTSVLEVWPVH